MSKIKVSDYIMNYLSVIGVDTIFGVSGGGCMHLIDSVGRHPKIKFIPNLHEQSSSICADSYAQYKQDIGVCIVTSGPGSTNAITGVVASWIDSVPLLVLSGQVKRDDLMYNNPTFDLSLRQKGIQEVDICPMVKNITKMAITIYSADEVKKSLDRVINHAIHDRKGPVWLDIPLDIQNSMIDENLYINRFNPFRANPDEIIYYRSVKEFIKEFNESKKPIIIVGKGIDNFACLSKFRDLIIKLNIPVITTWRAMEFLDENDSLFVGRSGIIGQRYANKLQQESDFILSIGARLDLGQVAFNYKNFGKNAKLAVVDIHYGELEKIRIKRKVDFSFNCDAGVFIEKMIININNGKIKTNRKNYIDIKEKGKYDVVKENQFQNKEGYVNTYNLIEELSKQCDCKDVIVPSSSGSASEITQQAWKVKYGQRIICSQGLGSMGFALPHAIGTSISSGRRVICIEGDGSLQHNIQELELLKRYNLNIKLFILNNQGYASIVNTQTKFFNNLVGSNEKSGLTLPNIKKIANAYNIKYFKIIDDINPLFKTVVKNVLVFKGPVICEVNVNPDLKILPRVQSKMVNGKMVSGKMENMFPYMEE